MQGLGYVGFRVLVLGFRGEIYCLGLGLGPVVV